jgi:hypothetical protein
MTYNLTTVKIESGNQVHIVPGSKLVKTYRQEG